ncbi:MAG TPA: alpha/beta fold hydrolase [Candidatus Baltobacteraceae bacterium]
MGRGERVRALLRPLTAAAGLAGAAALVNRRLRTRSDLPLDHLGGERLRRTFRGHDVFSTELGSGPIVLLVHGIDLGSSSFEYRRLAPLLAAQHRVIAFDFLGCGLSAMPDIRYSVDLFVEQIIAAAELAGEPVTLIGRSLGAAFALRAAAQRPDLVARLVAISPTGADDGASSEVAPAQRPLTALLRVPLLGETTFNALASARPLRHSLQAMYAQPNSLTPEIVAHYYAVTHQPGARFVPAYLFGGLLACNVARDLPFVPAPLLVLAGERGAQGDPLRKAAEYVRLAKDGRLVTFAHSGRLPHEEEPEATAAAIETFSVKGANAV